MNSNKQPQAKTDFLSYGVLGCLALCFGSAFFFTALAMDGISVSGTGAARVVISALFLVPLAFATGDGLPGSVWAWLWMTAYSLASWVLPFFLLVWAQTRVPTNILGAYFAAIPLLVLFFSWIFLRVQVSKRKWMGLLVGSIGLVLLAGPGTMSQIGGQSDLLAQAAVLAAVSGFAIGAIMIRVMPAKSSIQLVSGASLAGAIMVLPVLAIEIRTATLTTTAVTGILWLGIVSTALGQYLRIFLIRRRGPLFVLPNGYMAAMVTALLGVAFLGESLTASAVAAFGVIILGLTIASDGTGRMGQV